jgi:hypothetical protein
MPGVGRSVNILGRTRWGGEFEIREALRCEIASEKQETEIARAFAGKSAASAALPGPRRRHAC